MGLEPILVPWKAASARNCAGRKKPTKACGGGTTEDLLVLLSTRTQIQDLGLSSIMDQGVLQKQDSGMQARPPSES